MFPSFEYVAGLFDGEGSLSLSSYGKKMKGRGYCYPLVRVANGHRRVLELVKQEFGGTLQSYQPLYPGARLNYALALGKDQAKAFLQAIIPYLIVKRNVAWIVLCFLERGMKPRFGGHLKGRQGGLRLTDDDRELRAAVRELVMKINGRKGKRPLAPLLIAGS
jgi:hypothetical protein